MRFTRRAASLLLASPWLARTAQAQPAWSPSQPVRVIIPFTPGGTMDPVVRVVQEALQRDLGQPVVLEHKPGAATVVGTQEVVRAPADGHTLIMIANSFAANVTLRPSMPYKPLEDFAPIVQATVVPHVLAVHPSVARDFAGFLAKARAPGADFSFGSYGIGTSNHLGGEQFARGANFRATHVPYTGAAPAQAALVSGQVQGGFLNSTVAVPQIRAGALRGIAVADATRWRELPELPTTAELGYPAAAAISWSL